VGTAPDTLSLDEHRDLRGREWWPWVRIVLIALLVVLIVLGLLNVFGQRPVTLSAESPAAELTLRAPAKLRSGLYYEARFDVAARRELEDAVLVLDPDWLEGMTLNTVEPAPLREGSRDGQLVLELGRIRAGQSHVLFLQFQVNPTTVAFRRATDVTLEDGPRRLLRIDRTITVWP
jgi:hypothetical protein